MSFASGYVLSVGAGTSPLAAPDSRTLPKVRRSLLRSRQVAHRQPIAALRGRRGLPAPFASDCTGAMPMSLRKGLLTARNGKLGGD